MANADGADHGRVEKQKGHLERCGGQTLLEGHLHFHKGKYSKGALWEMLDNFVAGLISFLSPDNLQLTHLWRDFPGLHCPRVPTGGNPLQGGFVQGL